MHRGCSARYTAMTQMHLSADVWKLIGGFCLDQHELRTVCDVAEDLGSLQIVCKTSAHCADGHWSTVAKSCPQQHARFARSQCDRSRIWYHLDKQHVKIAESKLAQAVVLPPDLLTVFLHSHINRARYIQHQQAITTFHLTPHDLASCESRTCARGHKRLS